jgi:hemerythrin
MDINNLKTSLSQLVTQVESTDNVVNKLTTYVTESTSKNQTDLSKHQQALDILERLRDNFDFIFKQYQECERSSEYEKILNDIQYHEENIARLKKELTELNEFNQNTLKKAEETFSNFLKQSFPKLIQPTDGECHICRDQQDIYANICGHRMCKDCWMKIKNTSDKCPFCTLPIATNDLRIIRLQ